MGNEILVNEGDIHYFCSNHACNYSGDLSFSGGKSRTIPDTYEHYNIGGSSSTCPNCHTGKIKTSSATFHVVKPHNDFVEWNANYHCSACGTHWASQITCHEGEILELAHRADISCPICYNKSKISVSTLRRKIKV